MALPFVNHIISHVVKTYIRRNFQTYRITMHRIVLTSSAMWLFDVIKNVMSSTSSEKKEIPKLSRAHKAKVIVTFPKEQLKHPGYGPSHLQSWFGSMRLLVVSLHQSMVGWVEFSHIQGPVKAVNSELRALSPSDYQNASESWRKQLELCMRSGGWYFEGIWML